MGVLRKEPFLSNKEALADDVGMEKLNEEVYESESEDEDEDEDEDVKLAELSKNSIQQVDVNDDLVRELSFYTQALEGTRQALLKFQSMWLPFLPPFDYSAEMVKSDAHMEKVKGRLLVEKKKLEEAEEMKKARKAKKIAKEVQAQKLKERAKQKKEEIESIKKWKQQSGFAGGDKDGEIGLSFEDGKSFEKSNKKRPWVAPGDRSGGKAGQGGGKGKKGAG